jgi:hypothetical protein
MPRDGTQTYVLPFPDVDEDTTIESAVYNGFTNDVAADLNAPRPISSGGTGANSAADALFNMGAEKAAQVVTNYDSHLWVPGSFYSATTATGEPVDGHAFSGVAYIGEALANPPTNLNVTLEARDTTDGKLYIRRKTAGVWSAWILDGDLSGISGDIALKVAKAGDTMTGALELPTAAPTLGVHATNKTYVDAGDVALTAANALKVAKAGDTMTGMLVLPATTPTLGEHATNKTYVDAGDAATLVTAVTQATSRKNYILNGAMMISQENGAASGTSTGYYPVDQFSISQTIGANITCAQVASVTPGRSPNRIRYTIGTPADASVAAGDYISIVQGIEGFRIADLLVGSASAKTVTIAFGVKAPAGTYCVSVRNGATNRNYISEYVISGGEANTDVRKSVTIALDQSGTWLKDTGVGMYVSWALMSGTTYQGAANTWQAGNLQGTSNQFNVCATTGNVFELFDVSMTEGTTVPSFVVPDYASELALCMRYLEIGNAPTLWLGGFLPGSPNAGYGSTPFVVPKRIAPACSGAGWFYYSGSSGAACTPSFGSTGIYNIYWQASGLTNWQGWTGTGSWKAIARM